MRIVYNADVAQAYESGYPCRGRRLGIERRHVFQHIGVCYRKLFTMGRHAHHDTVVCGAYDTEHDSWPTRLGLDVLYESDHSRLAVLPMV